MNVHVLGIAMIIVSLIVGIMMLPSTPEITGAVIVEERAEQAQASKEVSYIGKDCQTKRFVYTTNATSTAECSSKELPYSCIAECTLRIMNKEDKAGNYSIEGIFAFQGDTKSEVVKKEISPLGNAQFRYTFQYKTSDMKKVPSCRFKPLTIPEHTTCTDVVRTRELP